MLSKFRFGIEQQSGGCWSILPPTPASILRGIFSRWCRVNTTLNLYLFEVFSTTEALSRCPWGVWHVFFLCFFCFFFNWPTWLLTKWSCSKKKIHKKKIAGIRVVVYVVMLSVIDYVYNYRKGNLHICRHVGENLKGHFKWLKRSLVAGMLFNLTLSVLG